MDLFSPSGVQGILAARESEYQDASRGRVALHGPEVEEKIAQARAEQRLDSERTVGVLQHQLQETQRLCLCFIWGGVGWSRIGGENDDNDGVPNVY